MINGMEDAERKARERLKDFNCHFLHMTSMEALPLIQDQSLDFVYIDGNHEFPYVAMDVAFWSKKVRSGGIVSGHDFLKEKPRSNMHVPPVLWGYTDAYRIKPWFILGTRARVTGEVRDTHRSWMWVKP
jgi:DNA repair exonuclease SbcCD nuclease subunit